MNENDEKIKKISIKQQRAMELMLTGTSIEEISEQLNVSANTVYRWKTNPIFDCLITDKKNEILENSFTKIKSLSNECVNVLVDLMNKSENENIKMKTAMFILDKVIILNQDDITTRLNQIESLVKERLL